MIKKIGASLLTIVIAIGFTPVTANAQAKPVDKKKVQKEFAKLKKLPNGAAPNGKVNSISKKLFKLDPKKTTKYYKLAIKKYAPQSQFTQGTKLANAAMKTVAKSGLSASQIKKIDKQVTKEENKLEPYQASVSFREILAA